MLPKIWFLKPEGKKKVIIFTDLSQETGLYACLIGTTWMLTLSFSPAANAGAGGPFDVYKICGLTLELGLCQARHRHVWVVKSGLILDSTQLQLSVGGPYLHGVCRALSTWDHWLPDLISERRSSEPWFSLLLNFSMSVLQELQVYPRISTSSITLFFNVCILVKSGWCTLFQVYTRWFS